MKIHTIESEPKIISIASSIDSDPRSWQGWSALSIESTYHISSADFNNAALSVISLVESYLGNVEGSAYFCANKYIYIICKNTSVPVLQQTGVQICDMAFGEFNSPVAYHLYDLAKNGPAFAEKILNNVGGQFLVDMPDEIERKSLGLNPERNISDTAPKVLLVEDDAVTRWMVRNTLKDECDFASASTAHNVFSMYSSFRPDIVFLDIGLPDNSGDEVLEWIIAHDPDACVVMLSSKDNIDNISDCLEKGAKGFIPKPFVRENLLHYIRSCSVAA
jgi:two-component system chemotaxis response regulator CheY